LTEINRILCVIFLGLSGYKE